MEDKDALPYKEALDLINSHDGIRFEAVKHLISRMSLMDIKLITNWCLEEERYRR